MRLFSWLLNLFRRAPARRSAPLDLSPGTPAAAVATAPPPEPVSEPASEIVANPVAATVAPGEPELAPIASPPEVEAVEPARPPEPAEALDPSAFGPTDMAALYAPDLEEDEDVFEEEEPVDDLELEEAGDLGPSLDDKIANQLNAVPHLRTEAEREALSGPHAIGLADPAGPGTLAEALARFEREGLVICELGEDENGAPVLLYRPKGDAPTVH